MAEKTEKPTEKKRRDSAKKGQTFRSRDLVATAVLISGVFSWEAVWILVHLSSFTVLPYYIMIR